MHANSDLYTEQDGGETVGGIYTEKGSHPYQGDKAQTAWLTAGTEQISSVQDTNMWIHVTRHSVCTTNRFQDTVGKHVPIKALWVDGHE